MPGRIQLEKRTFSLIGALLALIALLLSICLMNEFGHKSNATKPASSSQSVPDPPPAAEAVLTEKLLSKNTVNEVCSLKDLSLDGKGLKEILENKKLRGLKLAGCRFRKPLFPTLSNSSLDTISISNSELDFQLLDYLNKASSLKYVELFTCTLQPHSLDAFADSRIVRLQLRNSRELSSDNSFTDSDLESIANIKSLKHLELEHSELQSNATQGLKLCLAQVLNLNHCDLTDSDLQAIAAMKHIQYVDISYNPKLTYRGIEHLLRVPGIKQIKYDVDVSSSNLTKADKLRLDPALYKVPKSFYDKIVF